MRFAGESLWTKQIFDQFFRLLENLKFLSLFDLRTFVWRKNLSSFFNTIRLLFRTPHRPAKTF